MFEPVFRRIWKFKQSAKGDWFFEKSENSADRQKMGIIQLRYLYWNLYWAIESFYWRTKMNNEKCSLDQVQIKLGKHEPGHEKI